MLDLAVLTVELGAEKGFADPEDSGRSVRPEKIIGEAALLALAASPCRGRPDIDDGVRRLAERLAPHARSPKARARVGLEPSLALEHALAHLCLARVGWPDTTFDALLSASVKAVGSLGGERMPHRQLEQSWMLRLQGGDGARLGEERGLAARTALGRPADLVSMRRDTGYALTHAVMYITNLGRRPVKLPRPVGAIAAEAEAMLAACLDEPDYDLGAELVLTWPYLGRPWSASAALAFAVMAEIDDRLGFLPSPGAAAGKAAELTGRARRDYAVRSSYHTTFVMGLVYAAALAGDEAPALTPPPSKRLKGAAVPLLEIFGVAEPEPAWLTHVLALDPRSRDSAAPLLMNVALRRAIAKRDFAAVRQALMIGQGFGLLGGPFAYQAAQLLSRVALLPAGSLE